MRRRALTGAAGYRLFHVIPNGSVAHGADLGVHHVGPWALQAVVPGDEVVDALTLPGRGYFRTDEPTEFIPSGDYVYDNSPSNKGGTVPSGGLTIDGVDYPAGTKVCQFRDFSGQDFYASANGVNLLFRGLRKRDTQKAPGFMGVAGGTTSNYSFHYCDMGGTGATDVEYNEVPIKISSAGSGGTILRNYFSYTTTAIQINTNGYDLIENYIEKLTQFYGDEAPPGESTPKHLNGITLNGGETCVRILRNYVVGQTPDGEGRTINQTDCISFFQDFGTFPGSGTNSDATTGYQVIDNYVGGTGFCIYAGKNAGSASDSVNNMVLTGNKVTTQWYSTGGFNGPISAVPTWGTLGNSQSDNTWADGPDVGDSFI